jgi:hypothetical protein
MERRQRFSLAIDERLDQIDALSYFLSCPTVRVFHKSILDKPSAGGAGSVAESKSRPSFSTFPIPSH